MNKPTILSFGEIIWDCFPERRCLGGAPLNFAVHCARLGAQSYLYSAVGDEESLRATAGTGVLTDYISLVPFPTGKTNITLNKDGIPTYKPLYNTAWDNIPTIPVEDREWDAFYFGTFSQRSPVSAGSCRHLLDGVRAREIFCDLNLRHNCYSPELIDFCLSRAGIVKVNREEQAALPPALFDRYPRLKALLVTLDADGAQLHLADGRIIHSEKPRGPLVSAVGAGDSFSAAFLMSWLAGQSPEACLAAGIELSCRVIGQLGAF